LAATYRGTSEVQAFFDLKYRATEISTFQRYVFFKNTGGDFTGNFINFFIRLLGVKKNCLK